MIADELRRQADIFVDLQDLQGEVARAHSGEPRRTRPRNDDEDLYDEDDEEDIDYDEDDEGEAEVIRR